MIDCSDDSFSTMDDQFGKNLQGIL
jgi:hypothetical protein